MHDSIHNIEHHCVNYCGSIIVIIAHGYNSDHYTYHIHTHTEEEEPVKQPNNLQPRVGILYPRLISTREQQVSRFVCYHEMYQKSQLLYTTKHTHTQTDRYTYTCTHTHGHTDTDTDTHLQLHYTYIDIWCACESLKAKYLYKCLLT